MIKGVLAPLLVASGIEIRSAVILMELKKI